MNDIKAESVVQWYEYLEKQLSDYFKYVPPFAKNMKTCSPLLATVIVEACEIIDSLLRYVSPPVVTIKGKQKEREELELPDFFELYSNKLQLPERTAILLITPPEYRTPFKIWSKISSSNFESPNWWKAHNKLKHQRLDYFLRKATLNTAIDALAGAIVIISSLPELVHILIRRNWFKLNLNPEIILDAVNKNNLTSLFPFTVETSLFAVIFNKNPLPPNINDFRPVLYRGSSRLIKFFSKL